MSYARDREPITIFLPKGGRAIVHRRAKSAGCRSMNDYCSQMLIGGKVNTKKPRA